MIRVKEARQGPEDGMAYASLDFADTVYPLRLDQRFSTAILDTTKVVLCFDNRSRPIEIKPNWPRPVAIACFALNAKLGIM